MAVSTVNVPVVGAADESAYAALVTSELYTTDWSEDPSD
jgi:hypothetical protein